jgi:hypothetical protein
MERNSGLQAWLKIPSLYNLLQDAIGGNALRRKVIQNHVRAQAGDKVIDIGCGPAQILPWLPKVEYLESILYCFCQTGTRYGGDFRSRRHEVSFGGCEIQKCGHRDRTWHFASLERRRR